MADDTVMIGAVRPARGGLVGEHAPRDVLRQEERPAQVDRHEAVEALRRRIQHVAAFGDGDAGVVDKARRRAESRRCLVQHFVVVRDVGDVADQRFGLRPDPANGGDGFIELVGIEVVGDDAKAFAGKRQRDGATDSAPGAGYERHTFVLSAGHFNCPPGGCAR